MKTTNRLLLAGLFAMGSAWAGTPIEVILPADHIYSPKGFDANDSTEVIVTGVLPNLCHKSPITTVKVKNNVAYITLKALKYDSSDPFCPEIALPFVQPVSLGVLDKGVYKVVVNNKTAYEMKGEIAVSESTSDSVDDYIYANVGYVERYEGSNVIELKGYNPSDCLQLDTIQFVDNGVDSYSVLPKMKQVSTHCPMKMVPFTFKTEVPTVLKADKVLLHVRVMDGKSVNAIYSNMED